MIYSDRRFIFWSYVHITFSFILSDARPAWIVCRFQVRKTYSPGLPASSD